MSELVPNFRPAVAADSAAVVEVATAVYVEYGFQWDMHDLEDLAAHHLTDTSSFWVAELGNHVVGIVGLKLAHEVVGDVACDCSVHRMYVHHDVRRVGIASGLMDCVLGSARRAGCSTMAIWTDKRFDGAHRMYDGLGARRVTERDLGDINHSHEWGYVLDL